MPEPASNALAKAANPHPPVREVGTRSEKLLRECRSITALRLLKTLPGIMERVDDALFELAEQSDNNPQQSYYFEAMRKMRLERSGIEVRFNQNLTNESEPVCDEPGAGASEADPWDLSATSLGLVDNDDLEVSLAVTNLVAKIKGSCKEELFALDKRNGWLLKDPELEETGNPIGPAAICDAYKEACKDVDTDIEIKLIVLKLFDKHIVDEVRGLYEEINQLLVQREILPHIKTEIKRSPNRDPVSTSTAAGDPPAAATYQNAAPSHFLGEAGPMSGISIPGGIAHGSAAVAGIAVAGESLGVDTAHSGAGVIGGVLAPPQALYNTVQQIMRLNGGDDNPLPPVSGQVLSNLTALQSGTGGVVTTAQGGIDEEQLHTGTSNVLYQLKAANVAQGMNQVDDLMIDVVAMMFDYILDDKNIPAAMKARIGRLQIPLLKVAILDKGFFARKFHPARKLLNHMAEAALGWSETSDGGEALYQQLDTIVQRVLNEFQDDVAIFSEVVTELESFLEAEERTAEANAWQSTQIIEGRERLAKAKLVVDKQLAERIEGIEGIGGGFVTRFLDEHWGNLLTTAYVKDGEDSEVWSNAIAVMDDLVWSIAPKPIHADRVRLVSLLPGLLKRIREGMSRIGVTDNQRDRFLKKLAKIHLAIIRPDPGSAHGPDGDEETTASRMVAAQTPVMEMQHRDVDVERANEDPTNEMDEEDDEDEPQVDREATTEELGSEWSLRVRAALERANRIIFQTAERKPPCKGMGTTAVTAVFHEGLVTIGHVGDSRIYRWRDSVLSQLTSDHSLRQEMVDKGFYTPERAEQEIASNLVTRALGAEATVEPTVQELESRPPDVYLLCSDGLSDMVEDGSIAEVLAAHELGLDATAEKLVSLANENGGRDNISVTLVKVLELESLDILEGYDPNDPLDIATLTDVGLRRSHNEDAVGHAHDQGIVVLADGMGGCNAGEVASALAIEAILAELKDEEAVTGPDESSQSDNNSGINFAAINALFQDEPDTPESEEEDDIDWPFDDCPAPDHLEMISTAGADADDRAERDRCVRIVRNLEVGAWVEFKHRDGASTRARLAWIRATSGNYLFTNRQGHKVVESSPLGLAVELREGNARALDDVALFDRALGNLMSKLRAPETG